MLAGFYLFYATSKRVVFPKNIFHTYIQGHRLYGKMGGASLILLSLTGMIWDQGWGAGLYFGMFIFMTVSSLVIILYPLFNKQSK